MPFVTSQWEHSCSSHLDVDQPVGLKKRLLSLARGHQFLQTVVKILMLIFFAIPFRFFWIVLMNLFQRLLCRPVSHLLFGISDCPVPMHPADGACHFFLVSCCVFFFSPSLQLLANIFPRTVAAPHAFVLLSFSLPQMQPEITSVTLALISGLAAAS